MKKKEIKRTTIKTLKTIAIATFFITLQANVYATTLEESTLVVGTQNLVQAIEQNPIQLVIGMLKAVIIMICFKEIYGIGVAILREFLDSILNVISLESTNLAEALLNNIQRRNLYSSCLFSVADLLACINMPIYYEGYRAISNEDRNFICINRIIKFR